MHDPERSCMEPQKTPRPHIGVLLPGLLFLAECQVGRGEPKLICGFSRIVDIHARAVLQNFLWKGRVRRGSEQQPGPIQNSPAW